MQTPDRHSRSVAERQGRRLLGVRCHGRQGDWRRDSHWLGFLALALGGISCLGLLTLLSPWKCGRQWAGEREERMERGKNGRSNGGTEGHFSRSTHGATGLSLMLCVRLPHSGLISGLFGPRHHTVFGRKPVSLH